ncbi:heparinase II/III family protein [Ruficoccus sp. ZRK36]|uniref:heparinase II/III domain-containing protein n=1 Tax=Ruficoccus sp. ZRK36 TaxID=2866311 RepID=UPI001C72E692|nr:heparinase II/III family protein [Ruficoccus sp. ZRK36]QYY36044.1 heparinase II/III-family protein [Ruficoccus sp. ZRK36]
MNEAPGVAPAKPLGEDNKLVSRYELLKRIHDDPAMAEARDEFVKKSRWLLEKPIIRRPMTLADIKDNKLGWDNRYTEEYLQFSLARTDIMVTAAVLSRCERMASAYVLSGDKAFLDHALEQMEELTTWDPLQRPGWSSYGKHGKYTDDGVWMATGRGMLACVVFIDSLPPEAIPADLKAKMDALLKREIKYVVDDWKSEKGWFVKAKAVFSNQWVIPLSGLVGATAYLGLDEYGEEYEYGIQRLLETFNAEGEQGEFVEGMSYSIATMKLLMPAVRSSLMVGDRRLADNAFMSNYGTWLAHHIQPNDYTINNFDNFYGYRFSLRNYIDIFADLAVLLNDPVALWVCKTQAEKDVYEYSMTRTLNGMIVKAMSDKGMKEPAPYAYYPKMQMLTWRDSWDKKASGLWMRGGAETDFHDHMDRGGVNFIVNGRAVLIEAALISYSYQDVLQYFRTITGHNVLQVGIIDPMKATIEEREAVGQPKKDEFRAAPLEVIYMDENGGEAEADMSQVYPTAEKWIRTIIWTKNTLEVRDEVVLTKPEIALFRWHLGLPLRELKDKYNDMSGIIAPGDEAVLTPGKLVAGDLTVTFEADCELDQSLQPLMDRTLDFKQGDHQCLVLQSAEPVKEMTLTTVFDVQEQ